MPVYHGLVEVLEQLPDTAEAPVVQKRDPVAAPMLLFAVSAPRGSVEVNTIVDNVVKERLEVDQRRRSDRPLRRAPARDSRVGQSRSAARPQLTV